MKASEQKLKSNIWKFYLLQIFGSMVFFVPIVVLFWQENGLNLTQIMILQSLFSLAVVVLEVPTGYFADIFGRKKSLVYASAFFAVGILVYSIGHNFYHFLVAELLWAFGASLASGADSALVYDTLEDLNQEKTYKKVWGNGLFYSLIALSVACVIGGFIGEMNFRWTFYAMIPFVFLLIPISLSMKEPRQHKRIFKKGYLFEMIEILKNSFVKNKKLRWLMIYSAVVFGFNGAVLWLYQPYFSLSGLNIVYFGLVFAAFNIVAALSAKYAHVIEEKIGQRRSLVMLVVLTGISYLLMGNFVFLFSFSFAFMQQFVRGFSSVVLTDYVNKLTTSDVRATVLSAQNLVGQLFYAAIIPIIGWIADVYTLVQALTILGITTLAAGSIILIILHKDRVV
ncbi:MAG: MFS transporter [Candidatus Aenigmarchaeota archaeon]|nr:MFS transporter [Candidatus Aenigmarchaeota archaeon]